MRFKKLFSNLEPEGQGRGIIRGVTRLLTSARAVLHHTDQKVPNIMDPSVCTTVALLEVELMWHSPTSILSGISISKVYFAIIQSTFTDLLKDSNRKNEND